MSTNKRRRLNCATAEQLLGARPACPLTDGDVLDGLLPAAAAPAHDRELAGEAEAVAAFRDAHLSPAIQPRRPLMSATTKLLAVKAVLVAMGITGGGVALAAVTGHLPSQIGGTPVAASSAQAPTSATATPSISESPNSNPTASLNSNPTASPSPSLRGLCQAYSARVGSNPGKALDNPAFTALFSAAGSKDKVAAFCTSLLAAKPGHRATAHPTGKPSSLPAQAPTAHPTGKPATTPAARPTAKPASRP